MARSCAETCFHKSVSDNLQRLRELSKQDLTKEFTDRKVDLRQAFVSTGMGDLQIKMLTLKLAEAKKRAAYTAASRCSHMQCHHTSCLQCPALYNRVINPTTKYLIEQLNEPNFVSFWKSHYCIGSNLGHWIMCCLIASLLSGRMMLQEQLDDLSRFPRASPLVGLTVAPQMCSNGVAFA